MKRIAFFVLAAAGLSAQALSPADREFLIAHMERTRQEFVKSISGLTPAQWAFRPPGGGWSIAECAEHITITEDALFGVATQALKSPAMKDAPPRTREQDERILKFMADRSKKAQAPEILKPTGQFPTPASTVTRFNERRDRSIQYVRSTGDDLRGHVGPSQLFGTMDPYQYLVMMSGHTARHTAQLNEVKTSPGYPKAE